MADYYSILKKTIASLPENNGAARRSVYSRARNAIVNQLKAYEPPLAPSDGDATHAFACWTPVGSPEAADAFARNVVDGLPSAVAVDLAAGHTPAGASGGSGKDDA